MIDIIETIIKGDYAAANKIFNEHMEEVVATRLLEERKRVGIKLTSDGEE